MKVILLAPTPPPAGGIAGWTVRMLDAELKNGWEVRVVDEKTSGNRQVFGQAGRRSLSEEFRRSRRIWRDLKQALKDPDARVVHSCIPSVTTAMLREWVCAGITRRRKRKFIIHFRCTVPNTTQGRLGRFMLRRLCARSDLILSLNRQSSDYLAKVTKTPVTLIPNFISAGELTERPEVREELKTVLYVGGLVENKGVGDCLKIAERLPDVQFRFVGKGDSAFEERAKAAGLKNVVFTGQKDRDGVKAELAQADAFLFMTYFRGEGFSNALCEAMAAGLPCVATDWAANRDMIGETGGAVVPVHGVDEAVRALEAMRPRSARLAMSEANLRKVREEYADSAVLGQYVDAYEGLLK